jgi:hypothetical protein
MKLMSRVLLTLPLVIALILNVLVYVVRYNKHVEVYGFAFALPWGWLLDRLWFPGSGWLVWSRSLVNTIELLWIPALLYSLCPYGLLRLFRIVAGRIKAPS